MNARSSTLLLSCLAVVAPAAAQEALVRFDAPQVQLGAYDTPPFQRLFDYDGDGDLDAVGARVAQDYGAATSYDYRVFENDGSGVFDSVTTDFALSLPATTNPGGMPITVGDFDADGLEDFALAAGVELWVFDSPGVPGVAFARTAVQLGTTLRDVEAGDFDGDGDDDLGLLTNVGIEVRWSGGGTNSVPYDSVQNGIDRLVAADADGDPLPDLIAVGGAKMVPVDVEPSGLTLIWEYFFDQYGPMVDCGDIDVDGDEDLVAFHPPLGLVPAKVEVFRRAGPASWYQETPYLGGPAEYLEDIDGDGDPDGVCCSSGGGGSFPNLTFPSTFEIAINSSGTFEPAFEIPGLGSKSMAGARDVDGDGDVDLVAGRCVYFGRNEWSRGPKPSLTTIETEIELADLDGDGDVDPWAQSILNPGIESQAYRSLGDGTYQWQPMVMESLPPGLAPGGPRVLCDLDGDGARDVILGVWQGSTFLHQVAWRNSGGGSFHYSGACTPAGESFFIDTVVTAGNFVTGDIEADGDEDLVMRRSPAALVGASYGRSKVYLNGGSGFLTLAKLYQTEQVHALADFDGDGLPDALMTGGPLGLRLGQRQGSPEPFGAWVSAFPLYYPGWMAELDVQDFNGDGALDVLGIEFISQPGDGDRFARVFVNQLAQGGGLTFVKTEVSADGATEASSRAIGTDANGDGRLDVVLGPFESDRSYRVYLQKRGAPAQLGPGAFEPGVELVMPGLLRDDVDGDGDVDLVGEHLSRNLLVHGADQGSRRQYGLGAPGTGGVRPTLGAAGPFRFGESPELRLTGLGGTVAALAVTHQDAAIGNFLFPGLTLLVDPFAPGLFILDLSIPGAGAGPGEGELAIPVNVKPALIGPEWFHQLWIVDSGAPNGFLANTNGLRLTYGP